jgi:hypothetical protein
VASGGYPLNHWKPSRKKELEPDLIETNLRFEPLDKFFCLLGRIYVEREDNSLVQGTVFGVHESSPFSNFPVFLAYFPLKVKDKIKG